MGQLITQIYEIQTPDEARLMADCGVDHIGSVVLSGADWKQPVVYDTIRMAADRNVRSSLILLFNDKPTVVSALSYYKPDIVHFCEDLVPLVSSGDPNASLQPLIHLQAEVRAHFPDIEIMRSIPVVEAGDRRGPPALEFVRLFEPVSDYFLTDTRISGDPVQPVCGFVGITGRTCDWQAAAELVAYSRIPVILAGGLAPENVFEGVRGVRPAGVDSCTRTNAVDRAGRPIRFKKDVEKVKAFVRQARRAQQGLQGKAVS